MKSTRFYCVLAVVALLAQTARAADDTVKLRLEGVCSSERKASFDRNDQAAIIEAYQVLAEEALSLRARAISFLREIEEKHNRGEPLSGRDLERLNKGAAAILAQRGTLLKVAVSHECWLAVPIPSDPALARAQALGVTLSLSAALLLYDNYLSAIDLYRSDSFLRQHLNRKDKGFGLEGRQLTAIETSFSSAINRARVRHGLAWYEANAGMLVNSNDMGERYLVGLVEQSPAYAMVRRFRPIGYVSNLSDLFNKLSVDTLNTLQREGTHVTSMVVGNTIGLVETRRGKLDGNAPVLEKLSAALQAGDVLLEKTLFRLSDALIPGHWGHAAVWVGTEDELRRLGIWDHPVVRRYQQRIATGRGVVEALRSGVTMNTLSHFLNIDDLAVLRHEALSDAQRAEVILQALRQVGKAYDFNFDVQSTDRVVCSSLVYHAYGDVHWPSARAVGRTTFSPDNVAVMATGKGPFMVKALYHDGKEVQTEQQKMLVALLANSKLPGEAP